MENCRFKASSTRNKALKMDYQGVPALLVDHDRGSSRALGAWTAVTKKQKRNVNSAKKTRQDKKARTSEGTEPRRHKGGEDTGPKSKAGLQATAQKKKRGASKAPRPSGVGVRAQKRKLKEDEEERLSAADAALARFQDRYVQRHRLGDGGCGSVFSGYRKKDSLLVAIKHIPHDKVYCKFMTVKGKEISMEVVSMLKLKAARKTCLGAFAPITLLDWFNLDEKLILVLERPVPSKDLLVYRDNKGGCLEEGEARILMKQLVGAALYLQEMRIFHRDIKMENILIQTNRTVPIVRLIDFGLSCFVKEKTVFSSFYGTAEHAPPEWHQHSQCWAGPSTVWQLGVVLYEILHKHSAFNTKGFLKKELEINSRLSEICKDFLKKCLTPFRLRRATLQELKCHLWLH